MTSSAFCPRCIGSVVQSLPRRPLLLPIRDDRNLSDLALAEAWDSLGGWLKIQDCLLDVRGEVGEVEDLRDAGACDAGGAGEFGLVLDLACVEEMVKANRKRHELRNVRHS